MVRSVLFLSVAVALGGYATAVGAGERPAMEITPSDRAPADGLAFDVTGASGHYDRAVVRSSVLPVALRAEVKDADARIKILTSRIYLKSEGAAGAVATGNALDAAPARRLDIKDIALAQISTDGPLAQDAIAACNRLPAAARATAGGEAVPMSVALVWQVTTGRFEFNWRNYDRVGPSEDIVENSDFYRDSAEFQHETAITAEVSCKPLEKAVAEVAPSKTLLQDVATSMPERTPGAPGREREGKPAASAARVATAAVTASTAPRCDGGMVRQSARDGAYLCLCPGNTKRIERGEDGFACVRPGRR